MKDERIWLRPIEPGDAEAFADAVALDDDPAVPGPMIPLSPWTFRAWIDAANERERIYAICRGGDPIPIGSISLRNIDATHGTAETGMGLLYAADRGRGIGTRAKEALLRIAFEDLGLHALHCTIAASNARSRRAVEKQGYRFAGRVHRGQPDHHGGCDDVAYYDLLASEWRERHALSNTDARTAESSSPES